MYSLMFKKTRFDPYQNTMIVFIFIYIVIFCNTLSGHFCMTNMYKSLNCLTQWVIIIFNFMLYTCYSGFKKKYVCMVKVMISQFSFHWPFNIKNKIEIILLLDFCIMKHLSRFVYFVFMLWFPFKITCDILHWIIPLNLFSVWRFNAVLQFFKLLLFL